MLAEFAGLPRPGGGGGGGGGARGSKNVTVLGRDYMGPRSRVGEEAVRVAEGDKNWREIQAAMHQLEADAEASAHAAQVRQQRPSSPTTPPPPFFSALAGSSAPSVTRGRWGAAGQRGRGQSLRGGGLRIVSDLFLLLNCSNRWTPLFPASALAAHVFGRRNSMPARELPPSESDCDR